MVDYNAIFNKKVGVIPIKKYNDFYERFGKYLKTTNQHTIMTNHKVNCSQCGYGFPREALLFFTTEGEKRLTRRRTVIAKDERWVQRSLEGKCPKCGNRDIKISIVKLKVETLKGRHEIVFVCGETREKDFHYSKVERKFVNWLKKNQAANLAPNVKVYTFQFRALPDSKNRKGIDRFVVGLQTKKHTGRRQYQLKSYKQDGYHFIVLYM